MKLGGAGHIYSRPLEGVVGQLRLCIKAFQLYFSDMFSVFSSQRNYPLLTKMGLILPNRYSKLLSSLVSRVQNLYPSGL